jgi:hypothetical protein
MSPAETNAAQSPPANRLTIAHLLLWTATTALAIGTIMPDPIDAPFPSDMPDQVRGYLMREQQQWRVATVVTGPVLGAGLAALAMTIWSRFRREPGFPAQPGHWILTIVGACTVAAMYIRLFERPFGLSSDFIRLLLIVMFWATFLLPVIILVVAYFRVAKPVRWKRVFAIAIVSVALLFLGGCSGLFFLGPRTAQWIVPPILYATPISIVVAAVLDIRSGRTYDVFHWVGVVAVPALAVILSGLVFLS